MYYVWNPQRGGPPNHQHETVGGARKEAFRLSRKLKGQKFLVLSVVSEHQEQILPTFGELNVGDRFKQRGRELVKTEPLKMIVDNECIIYNAIRLSPPAVAGKHSRFSDNSEVEI